MNRYRVVLVMALLLAIMVIGNGVSGAQQRQELHFLAPGFSPELVDLLKEELLPSFEAEYNVEVQIEPIGWGERTDRIAILLASGLSPDVIGTAYYSPYQEGGSGLLEPLDRYLGEWELTHTIPEPVWDTQRWRGSVVAVPLQFDLRAIAYNKNVFAESGFDTNAPPQSWEELLEAVRIMTRFDPSGASLAVRGISFWGAAQEMLGWIHTTGVPPVDLGEFRSNLNTSEAIEAARYYVELNRTSRIDLTAAGGGLQAGALAMTTVNPGSMQAIYQETEGDFVAQYGVFAPRRSPAHEPVSVGYINGLSIAAASTKKDLAWKLIEFLLSDEVLLAIQPLTGWMTPRVDLANAFGAPYLDIYYPLVPYIKPAQLPPPRNVSQGEFDVIMGRAINQEISPEQAVMEGHELWSRLLAEWRIELGE